MEGITISGFYFLSPVILTGALFLDFIFGDPDFSFHPVRLIGKLITKAENILRKTGLSETTAGTLGVISTILITQGILFILYTIISPYPVLREILSIVIIYFTIALKDLAVHGMRVKNALESDNIEGAKRYVSYIISRDTENLDKKAVIKCTLESISENSCDAVIAPLFWGLFLGVPGALAYRVINTLDAMWGYKTKKYLNFGKTAAIIDDVVNFIPARITGALICLTAPVSGGNITRAFKIMIRDHAKLKSPNAGYPEAAMAGALGIKLAGPGVYFGETVHKPEIGEDIHPAEQKKISGSIRLVYSAVGLFILIAYGAVLITPVQ